MRILYVLENYYPFVGGVETLFKNICEGMVKRGHEVIVVASRQNTTRHENINGVDVHRVDTINRYTFAHDAIDDACRYGRKCDLIHTSTYTGAFPAWIASKLWRKPSVLTVHEVLGDKWKQFGMSELYKWAEKGLLSLNFNKYVGVSESTCRQLAELGKESEVVYNGVDYNHWNPDKYEPICLHDCFTYLYYGRAGITKGVYNLVLAADVMRRIHSNSKLVMIVAKEPARERQKLVDMIKEYELQEYITLMESVPFDVLPRYILGADCIVVPSLSEGFGFTCAEACAMDKPVVASDVDSLPEVISGRYRLAQPYWRSLVANMEQVMNGHCKKKPLIKFEWEECIEGYERIYRGLVN